MGYSKKGSVRPTGRKGKCIDGKLKTTKPMPFEKIGDDGKLGPRNRQEYGKGKRK